MPWNRIASQYYMKHTSQGFVRFAYKSLCTCWLISIKREFWRQNYIFNEKTWVLENIVPKILNSDFLYSTHPMRWLKYWPRQIFQISVNISPVLFLIKNHLIPNILPLTLSSMNEHKVLKDEVIVFNHTFKWRPIHIKVLYILDAIFLQEVPLPMLTRITRHHLP